MPIISAASGLLSNLADEMHLPTDNAPLAPRLCSTNAALSRSSVLAATKVIINLSLEAEMLPVDYHEEAFYYFSFEYSCFKSFHLPPALIID